jgi:hypothetical protein
MVQPTTPGDGFQVFLECDLGSHRKCIKLRADITGVGGARLLSDVSVKVVEHKSHVAVDVPVQARGIDCLLPASHTVRGCQLIVDAAGNLPRAQPPLINENGFAGTMPL